MKTWIIKTLGVVLLSVSISGISYASDGDDISNDDMLEVGDSSAESNSIVQFVKDHIPTKDNGDTLSDEYDDLRSGASK